MAVQKLNEFLISKSNNKLSPTPHVELYSDSLKLTYPWRIYISEDIIKLKEDLDVNKLNKKLSARVYAGEGGEISFKVISVDVRTSGQRGIDIRVEYKYLKDVSSTYFSIVPPELLPLIGSKLRNINDIKSMCAGFNICGDSNFWKAMFRYNFKEVHDAYIKLGYTEFINMNLYLAFCLMKLNVDVFIRGYSSLNYLDYYSILVSRTHDLNKLVKPKELAMMGSVIMYIKHPNTYKVVKSNELLRNNLSAIADILLFDLDDFDDIISKVMYVNQPVNTQQIIDIINDDLFTEYYDNNLEYIIYTFLIMLDFRGISVNKDNIDHTLEIINNVMILDDTFVEHHADEYNLPEISILTSYMDKIKEENFELYQDVLKASNEERWSYLRKMLVRCDTTEK